MCRPYTGLPGCNLVEMAHYSQTSVISSQGELWDVPRRGLHRRKRYKVMVEDGGGLPGSTGVQAEHLACCHHSWSFASYAVWDKKGKELFLPCFWMFYAQTASSLNSGRQLLPAGALPPWPLLFELTHLLRATPGWLGNTVNWCRKRLEAQWEDEQGRGPESHRRGSVVIS